MHEIKEKILIATDFQEQSIIAIEYAKYFAKISNSEIVLLHVMEESGFLKKMFQSAEETVRINKEAQKLLDEQVDKLKTEFSVSTIIAYGKPYDKIIEIANKICPRLIVMGKTEAPSFSKKLMGSNTNHVVNESKYPILSVRGKDPLHYLTIAEKSIVVPLDLTKQIKEQLSVAIEIAKFFNDTVKLVTVLTQESAAIETQLLTKMNSALKVVEAAGVKCTMKLIENMHQSISRTIIDYVHQEKAQFMVIMTQQEGNFMDFFMGSNAKGILDQSDVPVLSVTPWDENSDNTLFKVVYDPLNVF